MIYRYLDLLLFCFGRYRIDRDDKDFLLTFGLKIIATAPESFLDEYFMENVKVPIPICGKFILPGINFLKNVMHVCKK